MCSTVDKCWWIVCCPLIVYLRRYLSGHMSSCRLWIFATRADVSRSTLIRPLTNRCDCHDMTSWKYTSKLSESFTKSTIDPEEFNGANELQQQISSKINQKYYPTSGTKLLVEGLCCLSTAVSVNASFWALIKFF